MIYLRKPSSQQLERVLDSSREADFNYPFTGVTRDLLVDGDGPKGFRLDRFTFRLGSGDEAFEAAREAIDSWQMFNHSMASLHPMDSNTSLQTCVTVLFGGYGLWILNPARILYRLSESNLRDGHVKQYGFAYGTLPGHIAKGEECFSVEMDTITKEVQFRITVISRPGHFLSWIGGMIMTREQKRFRRLAGRAMKSYVDLKLGIEPG
ncbi:MAG: DUF1990 family protein [Pirellulaceae bacterium]